MDEGFQPVGKGGGPTPNSSPRDYDGQIEALTLIVAHLAAQLTMAQIRLRALASALEADGAIDPAVVQGYVTQVADHEAGFYLRENLGDVLSNLIEVDDLAREIMEYLGNPGAQR